MRKKYEKYQISNIKNPPPPFWLSSNLCGETHFIFCMPYKSGLYLNLGVRYPKEYIQTTRGSCNRNNDIQVIVFSRDSSSQSTLTCTELTECCDIFNEKLKDACLLDASE